jgi:hypothetical protein
MATSNGKINGSNGDAKKGAKRSIDVEKTELEPTKRTKLSQRTDYSRWRMLDEKGRQTWHYLEDDEEVKEWPQSKADKYYLGLPLVQVTFPSFYSILIMNRGFRILLLRKPPSILSRSALNSSNTSNSHQETGVVNMADQCSCFLAPSLLGMSLRPKYQIILQRR